MPRPKLWLTADPHIGHGNVIHYSNRPWLKADGHSDVRAMNYALVENSNALVGKDDRLIIAGDFSWGPAAYQAGWVPLINGRKTLVLGNHDRLSKTCFRNMGFEEVVKRMRIGQVHIQHHPPLPSRADELWADGVKVVICGHVHERWAERTMLCGLRVINVGVDVRNFRPVSFDDIGVDPELLLEPRRAP